MLSRWKSDAQFADGPALWNDCWNDWEGWEKAWSIGRVPAWKASNSGSKCRALGGAERKPW